MAHSIVRGLSLRALACVLLLAVGSPAWADPPIVRTSSGPGSWALIASGLFVGATGAVLAIYGESSTRGNCPSLQSAQCSPDARDYRNTGFPLLGIGGAALIAGIVWLAVDRHALAKHPLQASADSPVGLRVSF